MEPIKFKGREDWEGESALIRETTERIGFPVFRIFKKAMF
jgi:hypothetical protein